jgi:phosphoribosylformimino-5-aminoimidazole carboxamide ribotide isomerase
VAAEGWIETSTVDANAIARRVDDSPLAAIVYNDKAREGTHEGPNLDATRELADSVKAPVIASGGVGGLEDLDLLAALPIAGCIVGRALYEGKFTLAEAITRVDALPCRT